MPRLRKPKDTEPEPEPEVVEPFVEEFREAPSPLFRDKRRPVVNAKGRCAICNKVPDHVHPEAS